MDVIQPQKVIYQNGDFDFIQEPPMSRIRYILPVQEELQFLLNGQHVWPPDLFDEGDNRTICDRLYELYWRHFEKLGKLMDPPIDIHQLTPLSRHEFFICTAPIRDPEKEDVIFAAGLSQLRKLLGHRIQMPNETVATEVEEDKFTTGSIVADITSAVLLNFEGKGMELLELPLTEVSAILTRIGKVVAARDKKEDGIFQIAAMDNLPAVDEEDYEMNKSIIETKLAEWGVVLPA